ncbi:MAG: hypothetical protein LW630_05540 [Saprospiraceae bacterium]|jgi:ligand-binding sensor domain-containing protein/DNA-binding CsgD family transcriptional regulator|nr:hypothetical protein [Saprospiraceae bacterium]
MQFYRIIFLIVLHNLFISGFLNGQKQSVYNPFVTNFTKQIYGGGTENWDVACSPDGHVFVANNEGLLSYDGKVWTLHRLPNKTIVRSVELDTINHRIYVGGQDEIGYFAADNSGRLQFTSIKKYIPTSVPSLEDVWDLQLAGSKVYFRSVNAIFVWDGTQIESLKLPSKRIHYLKIIQQRVFYADTDNGLYEILNGGAKKMMGSDILKNTRISDILVRPDGQWLVVTEKNGLYRYDGKAFNPFIKNSEVANAILNSAVDIGNGTIAIASVRKGILFCDDEGNYLYQITRDQGLQTHSVIRLGIDPSGDLWACTSNGIDKLLIHSPFRIMYPDVNLRGGVYAVRKYMNKLYVGTNNGLYVTEWQADQKGYKTATFREVANTSGQVWGLDVVHGDLFMGHNEGSYQIIGETAVKLSEAYAGSWRHIAGPREDVMVAGTYGGLERYVKKGSQWIHSGHLKGFEESSRIIAVDQQHQLWISHPYRGVFRLTFSADYASILSKLQFDASRGLPSNMDHYVSELNDQIYVSGNNGIFVYHEVEGKFQQDTALTRHFGSTDKTRRLFQEDGENIWFIAEEECGMLQVNTSPVSKEVHKHLFPFLKGKFIGGFENIYIPDNREVFVCTDKGLILVQLDQLKRKTILTLRFNKVFSRGTQDSILYGGFFTTALLQKIQIPYLQNNMGFILGTNQGDDTQPIQYRWKLEGRDKEWSDWQYKDEVLFSHLKPGKYTFLAAARDSKGYESNILQYTFTIQKPWYASYPAILCYVLLLGSLFLILTRYLNKKHEGEKTQLIQEKEVSEALVQDLLNQKLQTEIDFKNRELALSTMHIVQKNETLSKLREELYSVSKNVVDQETKKQIRKIISILSDDQVLEGDWESFARHFDQVHTDFIKRLKETYPQLSPKDLKLCAYLRLNLSTKELAPLLNISVRGVEISRYRLRKKLHLHADINLNDYMMNF